MHKTIVNSKDNLLSEFELKKYILKEYILEDASIYQIKFKDTDKQRAVYKIEYDDKYYCLKKVYYSKDELRFVYSSIEWLYRFNLNVPRILPTSSGNRYVLFNDMLFILTPWIQGEKCNYDNYGHVIDSARTLGNMHATGKNFYPITGSKLRLGYDDIYMEMSRHFNQLLNYSNLAFKYGDAFSKLYIENFEMCINLAKLSIESASRINFNFLNKSLCHLDYVNKNIIFDNENRLWIIDFDKCKLDYCAHDISYFLRRIMKRDSTNWNLQLLMDCLETYEEIMPLSIDEYWYILSYLSFPQKQWRLLRDYYNNINICNKTAFVGLLEKSINTMENHIKTSLAFKDIILSM
jgi:CotS family spore coat protein